MFEEEVHESFGFLYDSLQNEYVACLNGESINGTLHITSFEETDVFERDEDVVSFASCKKTSDFLGTLHSHPQPSNPSLRAVCKLSDQDLFTFGSVDEKISCVQCGTEEFRCFTPQNLDKGLNVIKG